MEAADWPLVGREAARMAIVSALAEEPVHSVVIAGPAGVGRTRLAREAVEVATREGRPVRWAAGTAPAAVVPLGALAHLIPAVDVASDPLALLQRATAAIVGDGSVPAPVLAVDDVHLLDQLSITLLHQLAASGAVPMILTVRTGRGVKDPVAPLWKDGRATRFDLQPLGRADNDQLITQVLAGDLETRTAERLWQLTRGNPLFLREILEEGRRSGRLRQAGELWRWEGPISPSQRLVDIVLGHIGDLDTAEWRALEVLAMAQPLSVHHLVAFSSAEAVASLERRGVISGHVAGEPGELCTAHPMYAAVVRCRTSEAAIQLVQEQLTDVEDDPRTDPDHLLQRCVAMVHREVPERDPGLLTDGALCAMTVRDVALAERLARAAVEAGGGIAAYLPLVEATRWSGAPERSESLAVEAARLAATDVDIARLVTARVLNQFCALGRPQDAVDALREAGASVRSAEGRALLGATQSMLAVLSGERRAVRVAADALSATPPGHPGRPLAAAAAALSLAVAGQTERALAAAELGRAAVETSPVSEAFFTRAVLTLAEALALYLAGRLGELDRRTEAWLRQNLKAPEWAGDAIAATQRGWAALAGGGPGRSVRWLEEAFSRLESNDPAGLRSFCGSLLVTACALAGDVGRAREVSADLSRSPGRSLPVLVPISALAQASLAEAEGRIADAGTLLLEAAARAAERGQPGVQALLLYRAVHIDRADEVADQLRDLAAGLDSPLVEAFAAHAQAAKAREGRLLAESSRRLQEIGTTSFAAEAAAEAAAAYERAGVRRLAAEWTTKARVLTQECGLPEPQGLGSLPSTEMTSRETEVARLASHGLSNQEIAGRLYLSVRTVETHLSHVYTKLGITGRGGLAASFPARRPASS
ncbi:helix-turn-helix transcriptional regulator [Blastococcus mobilis]|uniref:Regulatory protein, luxR family n=1 Tax=Blastococcus mobilis TaxID=1938746 RepID=A0A238Z439_9ACTN|nr:LuxR family transcriptional regulator [Blastococcus mobilis]SNR78096.1 regulatory protein, luxR family [Blastococcus mobilis]